MIVTFDKGLATERVLTIDHYSENVLQNRLNGNANFSDEDYPELEGFTNTSFETLEMTKNGKRVRFSGHYNTISNLSISYDELTDNYNLGLGLTWTDEEKE